MHLEVSRSTSYSVDEQVDLADVHIMVFMPMSISMSAIGSSRPQKREGGYSRMLRFYLFLSFLIGT